MHHCHSFSRFSRPYRPVIIDMHSPRGSWRCSRCVSFAFPRVTPQGKCLDRATRSQIVLLGLMEGTPELAATSFLRVTLVPIIDLDVIQFAAETVTAATSAPAPDPCRSLTPTRRRKTSAPHPSAGGHLRELTSCAGTNLDPCGHRVQPLLRSGERGCRVSCGS